MADGRDAAFASPLLAASVDGDNDRTPRRLLRSHLLGKRDMRRSRVSVGIAVLFAMSCSCVGATELTDSEIRAYYLAWSAGDVGRLLGYFSADAVYEDVATGERANGISEVRTFAETFLKRTPGMRVEPTSILIGTESAAVEWTMSGGAGKEAWHVRGVAILEHKGGQITRATDYWNAD